MKETIIKLAPRLIPAPVKPTVAKIYQPLARSIVASKFRRKYGSFVSEVNSNDEIMHFACDMARELPAFKYYYAVRSYLDGGEVNVEDVERVLRDVNRPLQQASSFLEFACGYGRLTRHFVHRLSPSKITVSDIDQRAVDFVKEKFNVSGFYSTTKANELIHDGSYDVIVVVSLFSHLSIEDWGDWLKRLYAMLNEKGLLVFSTFGIHAYGLLSDAEKTGYEMKADGFYYAKVNETYGRLSADHYGSAFVTDKYVEDFVSSNSVGRLIKFYPTALNHYQDAYIIERR